MFLQHGNNQIQWEIQFMIINDNIDFVTVIYKRLDYAKLTPLLTAALQEICKKKKVYFIND